MRQTTARLDAGPVIGPTATNGTGSFKRGCSLLGFADPKVAGPPDHPIAEYAGDSPEILKLLEARR